MNRIYKGVQDNYVEGTRQISSVTSEERVTFLRKLEIVDTKEEEATVY